MENLLTFSIGPLFFLSGISEVFYMAILLLLLFIGVKLNVDFLYWIIWGVAFTIESINLLGCIQFESNDEEDNNE